MKDATEANRLRIRHSTEQTPPWLRRFTKVVATLTLFLILAGALVTSHDAGLSVPDWPTTYGSNMFTFPISKWVGNIVYEHGHRLLASSIGFLVIVQALWLQFREPKRFVRRLGWISLGVVIAQGILGGMTVLFLLPKAISISHAGLAEIFFCVNTSIAFFTSRWYETLRTVERGDAPVRGAWALTALVYAQIIAGAVVRHFHAGLAIPDFPRSFGRWIPTFTTPEIIAAFVHRAGGAVVALAVIAMAVRLMRYDRDHPLRFMGSLLMIIVAAQIFLGAEVIWTGRQPLITSLHVMMGALTLATSLVLTLSSQTVAWRKVRAENGRGAVLASGVTA